MLLASGLGDQRAVDEPVEQHRIDLLERQLLRLRRQVLLSGLDIGQVELDPVDPRDDRIARRQGARRRAAGRRRRRGGSAAISVPGRAGEPGRADEGRAPGADKGRGSIAITFNRGNAAALWRRRLINAYRRHADKPTACAEVLRAATSDAAGGGAAELTPGRPAYLSIGRRANTFRLPSPFSEGPMLGALARRLFGSANDRYVKSLGPIVSAINELEPELEAMSDDELRARTAALQGAARRRGRARRPAGRRLRDGARGGQAHARPAPFRRAADGRHRAASRHDRRDEDRRGQDPGRDPAGLSQRAGRQRACTSSPSTTISPAATPNGWARSTAFSASRSAASSTSSTTCSASEAYPCDVTYGTNNEFGFDYLRDNMKFRLEDMVQRPFHYAIVDEVDSILIDEARTPLIISGPTEDNSELYIRVDKLIPALEDRRLREGREAAHRRPDRNGGREDRGDAAPSRPDDDGHALRHPQCRARPSRQSGVARAQAVRPRHRLHQQGRQDHHHRRVHRPHDGGPALLRGAAPGARGQGGRHRPEREPDARLDHLPELFPPLPEARRHDRHGDDRGAGVQRHLQARGHRDPDQRAVYPRRHRRRGLPHDAREIRRDRAARAGVPASGSSRCWSAPSASRNPRRCRRSSRSTRSRTTC